MKSAFELLKNILFGFGVLALSGCVLFVASFLGFFSLLAMIGQSSREEPGERMRSFGR